MLQLPELKSIGTFSMHNDQDIRTHSRGVGCISAVRTHAGLADQAGKPVQTVFKRNEDHGFISEANRAEFFRKLVDFMDASIEVKGE